MASLLCSRCCTRLQLPATLRRSTSRPVYAIALLQYSTRPNDHRSRGSVLDSPVLRLKGGYGIGKTPIAICLTPPIIAAACFSAASVFTSVRKSWFDHPFVLGLLFICLIQFYKSRKREQKRLRELASNPSEVEVDDYLAYLYQLFPLRTGSRIVGYVGEKQLPKPVLTPILNFYCWYFGVNLEEAAEESINAYNSLGEFFQRELKPSVRQIHSTSPLVVPCDGRVLHYGRCKDGIVEQVKGVRYPVERFLGSSPALRDPEHNDLFYCVLYLAPGDYHLFHSPCSWTVDKVIHFPGTLMSVNPSICKIVRNILVLNERVLLSGSWEHGYFSYTAVGATNVGSIRIDFLKDSEDAIQTNKGFLSFTKDTEILLDPKQDLSRGEMVGGFNFGSTIVLMFEAPKSFTFNLESDQTIRLGNPLGEIPSTNSDTENPVLDDFRDTLDAVEDLRETLDVVVKTLSDPTEQLIKLGDEVIDQIIDNSETERGAEKAA